MGSQEIVGLFYNETKKIVALAPADAGALSAYPARRQGQQANYYIAGQMFTNFHEIDTRVVRICHRSGAHSLSRPQWA